MSERLTDAELEQLHLQPLGMRIQFDDDVPGDWGARRFWADLMEKAHAEIIHLRAALSRVHGEAEEEREKQ